MSKLAAALSVIYQIICNGGVSRVAGTKICCHRRGTNDEDDGLDRWAATGCAKGGGGDDGGLDFLEDTEFPEATDFKASVLMLIQKEFRTTNKKLYKILIEDKNQALRSELGRNDIQSTFNVAMDKRQVWRVEEGEMMGGLEAILVPGLLLATYCLWVCQPSLDLSSAALSFILPAAFFAFIAFFFYLCRSLSFSVSSFMKTSTGTPLASD